MMSRNYQYVDPMEQSAAELRGKKRIKQTIAYLAAFMVFNILFITAIALTVIHVKNPKFLIMAAEVENLRYAPDTNSPSLNMELHCVVSVKNTNFGQFRYENSAVVFAYGNVTVGEASVAEAGVGARSTREVNTTVKISSDNVSRNLKLGNDITSGMLSLNSYGRLNGKVHLMKVMEKRKSAQMNCAMKINLAEGMIEDLKCN